MTNEMNMGKANNDTNVNGAKTFEKSKMEKYSVETICRKIDNYEIRFNHAAQRESEQWTAKMKGNLISDILQNNPIPALIVAEQFKNGACIKWNLDGKQRCTTVHRYIHDGFKIPKDIRRSNICYQTFKRDENGDILFDEEGIQLVEWKEFNITGKLFSQLPEELQDQIKCYCFDVVLYLNCSSEDIVYHIARYNDGRPMNKTQKGIIQLGEDFAKEVKTISTHAFFSDNGDYGNNARTKGTIDRAICETVMASNYLDDWKSNQEDICAYLRQNATFDDFDDVTDTLNRLEDIVDGTNESLFTAKEAFIWLTVFNRFKTYNVDDEKFADFMTKFVEELHETVVNEKTYDDLEGRRSTKDKTLVVAKINHLETLLKMFLGIANENTAA